MNCEKWLEILLQTEGTVLCDKGTGVKKWIYPQRVKDRKKESGSKNISPNG